MTASPRNEQAPSLAIVIPALNEAANLAELLPALQPLRAAGHCLILCDGGSTDDTVAVARPLVDDLLHSPRGRALQMNTAAHRADADLLVFLHADTRPPADFARAIQRACAAGARWGRFDVRLDSRRAALRGVAFMMNLRSRLTGIATGDQTLFVERALFHAVGGYPAIALMEDIALSSTLKRHAAPACLRDKVTTSARRWERDGVLRTILTMWRLRLAYWLGRDPAQLAAAYYGRER